MPWDLRQRLSAASILRVSFTSRLFQNVLPLSAGGTVIQYFIQCSAAPLGAVIHSSLQNPNKEEWMMKAIVAACALVIPALASADEVGLWYVNPIFGGVSVDNDRPVQDKDWLYGIGIGKHVNRGLSIELNQTGAQVGGGPGRSDLSLWGTSLDFLGVMNRGGTVSPYVSVGAGVLSDEPSPGRNSTDFMSQAGVGMFILLWVCSVGVCCF